MTPMNFCFSRLSCFSWFFILCLASAVFAEDPSPPKFDWTLEKPQDRIETKLDGDAVVFELRSKTGIGGGTVVLAAGAWPKKATLRLLDFPALEGFWAAA